MISMETLDKETTLLNDTGYFTKQTTNTLLFSGFLMVCGWYDLLSH